MKWSEEKVEQLKSLAYSGTSNLEIAKQLGVTISDVYAKRSQLGITIDKVRAMKSGKAAALNPNFEKVVPASPLEEKRQLLQLLEPAILMADKSVSSLGIIDGGKTVLVVHKNGAGTRVDIEGDSLLAIIADVTRKCLF
ncbi:MAG: hypothetical protein E7518_07090 [Ruminococcaceae bacterium]|nr:hypothetical protein [Oscillospiraceae bacterium]